MFSQGAKNLKWSRKDFEGELGIVKLGGLKISGMLR